MFRLSSDWDWKRQRDENLRTKRNNKNTDYMEHSKRIVVYQMKSNAQTYQMNGQPLFCNISKCVSLSNEWGVDGRYSNVSVNLSHNWNRQAIIHNLTYCLKTFFC